jgi:hypothetical protein
MKFIPINFLSYIFLFVLSISTLTAQIAADSQRYSIRYKGIRCNKSQEKNGDELTVYIMGRLAELQLSEVASLSRDSIAYEALETGKTFNGPMAVVFRGDQSQEASLSCSIKERDEAEMKQEQERANRFKTLAEKAATSTDKVESLLGTPRRPTTLTPVTPPENTDLSQESIQAAQPSPSLAQKGSGTLSLAVDFTKEILNRTPSQTSQILGTEYFLLEREDIQDYLKKERTVLGRIRYHFSIQIKNKDADYELFFDVNAEKN